MASGKEQTLDNNDFLRPLINHQRQKLCQASLKISSMSLLLENSLASGKDKRYIKGCRE